MRDVPKGDWLALARFHRVPAALLSIIIALVAAGRAAAAAPGIPVQPQSSTNLAGSTVLFSATATGTPTLRYQWQRNGASLADQGRISGTTSNVLRITSVLPADAGNFRLIVTNASGAITSTVAVLTVTIPATLAIPDPNLEAAIRAAISQPVGALTPAGLATLVSLSACGQNISNLSGLEWATNLASLSLSFNALTNLVALEGLGSLVQLSLDANRITDPSPLAGLTRLTGLNLGENLITNAGVLTGLTNLTSLWLHRNPLGSLAPLTNLGGLQTLVLSSAGVADGSPLAGLTNLTYLELRWNPLTNAEAVLAGLTNLTTLYLGGTGISNVNFLQYHSQLSFLNLDHAGVADFSPLIGLSGLRDLDAGYNPLTALAPLAAFTNLDSLYLSGNSISNVGALVGLGQLRALGLNGNQISDLTPLTGLTNLTTLALSQNPLTNWAGPEALTNLVQLWLDGSSISNLGFVQNMRSLEALGVRSSRQSGLSPLSSLTNLVALSADNNWLTNIDVLTILSRISRVQLTGNLLDLSTGSPPTAVVDTLRSRGATVLVAPQNERPTISLPTEWVIATNKTSTLVINARDDLTPGGQLIVTAVPSNPGLLPNPAILATADPNYWMLSVKPASNQAGTATISVTVTDDAGLSTNAVLSVNVVAPQAVVVADNNLNQSIGWTLGISSSSFNSLDLGALTTLTVSSGTISNLAGLEKAVNLQALEFTADNILNLSALQPLAKLQSLSIDANSVVDCSALAGLTNLTSLSLRGNSITNLDFLQNLKQLVGLSLETRAVTNFQPVAGLTNLTFLDLSDNTPGNLNFLASLSRLVSLGLSGGRITNIAPLATLTNLQVIQLARNRLTDVNALTNLPALVFLDVSYNLLTTPGNPALQTLLTRGVTVNYLPQRGPPTLQTPGTWFASANTTSYLRASSWDDGGSADEFPVVTVISTTTNLVVGAHLFSTHDLPRFPQDWILAVTPPGNYTGTAILKVVASSEVGLATTNTVTLTLSLPLPVNAQLLNDTNLSWQTGGSAPWFGQSQTTHDGVSAAQSGSIGDSQESWIQTTVTGPRLLSFWWKVSSEPAGDWLEFYTNGVRLNYRIAGEAGWEKVTQNLPAGAQTIRWRYVKDDGYSYGSDAAWLDEVSAKAPAAIAFSNLVQTYDGTPHAVSVTTTPPGLPVSLTYNGRSSAPTNAGSYRVSATINDASYHGTATNILILTVVTPQNVSTNLVVSGSDIDSPNPTYALLAGPAHGNLGTLNATNGAVTYGPTNGYHGPDSFTYTVTDGSLSATGQISITVTFVNDAPVAVNDSTNTLEDVSVNVSVLANDSDPQGTPLVITGTSAANGTAVVSGTNVVFTPGTNFNGTAAFSYTVSDGTNTATAQVLVTVIPVNDAPVALSQSVVSPEDMSTNLVMGGSDLDSPNLTYALLAGPAHGSLGALNAANGAVTYSPAHDYYGPDSFTFTVTDGSLTATGLVSLTVTPVNDAPLAVNDSTNTLEDVAVIVNVLANDSDPEGTPLVITGASTTNGTAIVGGTNVVFTPGTNFSGAAGFSYTVSDGTNTATAQVTVTVSPVNDAPTAGALAVTLPEDTSTNVTLIGGDVDNTNLLFAIQTSPTNGTTVLNTNTGVLTYTPNLNFNGIDFLRYTVSDGTLYATGTVSLTATPVNDPPTITGLAKQTINISTAAGPLSFAIGDVDTALSNLTLSAGSSNPALVPTNNVVFGGSGSNRTVTVTPVAGQSGTTTITLSVNDGALSAGTSFVLTVKAALPAAVVRVNAGGGTVTSISGTGWSADTGFNTGTSNSVSVPINNTVDDALYQTERWDPTNSPELTYSFNLANGDYLLNLHFAETYAGVFGVGLRVFDVLVEGQLRIDNLDIYSRVGSNTALIIGLPVTITDGQLNIQFVHGVQNPKISAIEAFRTVAPPAISDIANYTTTVNTPTPALAFTINDEDTPVTNLTLSGSSSNPTLVPAGNIVFGGSGSNRTVTVTPASNQRGSATITVTVSDGAVTSDESFVLTVNAPPTISSIAAQVINEDASSGPLSFTVGDAETASGGLTLGQNSSNTNLVPLANIVFGGSGSNRTVSVTPAPNQNGVTTLTLSVSDGQATTSTNFALTVTPVNDAPTITGISNQTILVEGATGPLSFAIGDMDTALTNLTLSAGSSNPALVPTNNVLFGGSGSNRTVAVTPAPGQIGTAGITLWVSDGFLSASNGFLLTVNARAPVILFLNRGVTNSVLTWSSTSNLNYRVQYAPDLATPWITLIPDVHATNTTASAVDPTGGVAQRYYRVMVVP